MYIKSFKLTSFGIFDLNEKFQSGFRTHSNPETTLVKMYGWISSQNTVQILTFFCKGILLKLVALGSELNCRKSIIIHNFLLKTQLLHPEKTAERLLSPETLLDGMCDQVPEAFRKKRSLLSWPSYLLCQGKRSFALPTLSRYSCCFQTKQNIMSCWNLWERHDFTLITKYFTQSHGHYTETQTSSETKPVMGRMTEGCPWPRTNFLTWCLDFTGSQRCSWSRCSFFYALKEMCKKRSSQFFLRSLQIKI